MPKVTGKKWYLSKTLYFNVVTFVLAVVQAYAGVWYVPAEVMGYITMVGNFLLRLLTTEKLTV